MTTNFIPNKGGMYYFASNRRVYALWWDADSDDIDIARGMGVFPHTPDGRELADWQYAILTETPKFWEWVDDYELYT